MKRAVLAAMIMLMVAVGHWLWALYRVFEPVVPLVELPFGKYTLPVYLFGMGCFWLVMALAQRHLAKGYLSSGN